MDPSARNELIREITTIVAEVMAQSNERIFGKMAELQEQTIRLEHRQLELLERISERQDVMTELQIKATEALGLILAKLRSN